MRMSPTSKGYPIMADEHVLSFPQVPQTKCEL